MSTSRRSPFVTLAAGILLGGIIGAVAALLAAPKAGVDTRAELLDKGNIIKNQTIAALRSGQANTLEFVNQLRARTEGLSNRTRNSNGHLPRTIPEIMIE